MGFPHVTETAVKGPNVCCVLNRPGGPFLDIGALPWTDPNVYISRPGFEVLCQTSRWAVPTPEHDRALQERDDARERVAELEAELEQKNTALGAVYALKQAGFVEGKKPGRPPKVAA